MEPIAKKKATVSPFNKVPSSEPIPDDTDISPLAPLTPAPDPMKKAVSGNTVLAPQASEQTADIAAVDKRVDGLINYLEQWIKVGNLNMNNIKEYIQNFSN